MHCLAFLPSQTTACRATSQNPEPVLSWREWVPPALHSGNGQEGALPDGELPPAPQAPATATAGPRLC